MHLGSHTHVRQESDEYVCTRCRKRWDVSDEPPVCEIESEEFTKRLEARGTRFLGRGQKQKRYT